MQQSDGEECFSLLAKHYESIKNALEHRAKKAGVIPEECISAFFCRKKIEQKDLLQRWLGLGFFMLRISPRCFEAKSMKSFIHNLFVISNVLGRVDAILENNLSDTKAFEKFVRTAMAKAGAAAMKANDPRQAEKKFVRECWQTWKINPDSYHSKAAFARDMLEKCEYLTSQKVIEDWCRNWEKLILPAE